MFVYSNDDPQTLVAICSNMGICDVFTQVAAREIYPGFILLAMIS